jgi:uncharacterized RDD family membrane protein YckC
MDTILDSPATGNPQFEYAGFWIRTVAYLIDSILLGVVQVALSYAIYGDYSFLEPRSMLTFLSVGIGIAYFGYMESSERQATIGKMAVGIRVGDAQGNSITFLNAVGRYLAKILSAIILGIGFIMVGFDLRKQGLHDRLADTFVFYQRSKV